MKLFINSNIALLFSINDSPGVVNPDDDVVSIPSDARLDSFSTETIREGVFKKRRTSGMYSGIFHYPRNNLGKKHCLVVTLTKMRDKSKTICIQCQIQIYPYFTLWLSK